MGFNSAYFNENNDQLEVNKKNWWDKASNLDYEDFESFYLESYDLSFQI